MKRTIGHLRGAMHYLSLRQTLQYMLDRDRLFHDDNIHPLDWLEWKKRS